jgi:hypothetical protein
MHELGAGVGLAEAMAEARRQRTRQRRRAVRGERDRRPQHGGPPARLRRPPLLDQRLGRRQLTGVHERRIRPQHGLLGERDRVVGDRPVDHRRRDHHERIDIEQIGVGEQLGGAFGDALATPAEQIVIGESDIDDGVARTGSGFRRGVTGGDDHIDGVQLPKMIGDTPTQTTAGTPHVHAPPCP